MKRLRILIAALFMGLLILPVFAQDVPAEPTAITTSAPDTASEEDSVTFALPPLDTEYAWVYGVFAALVLVILMLVGRLYGSVPLSSLPTLFGIAKGFTAVIPGKADDNALAWLEQLVKPNLDPSKWPQLIEDLVKQNIITAMVADETIAVIAGQKLNPYQAYAQAEAMAQHFRARQTVPVAQEGAGAQSALKPEGFRINA